MNDIEHQKNSDLVVSKTTYLDNNRLLLVKRGFSLIQRIQNRNFEILIGNFEDAINDLFFDLIKHVVHERININVKRLELVEDFFKYANAINVDIAIFQANNLQCLCKDENYEDSLFKVLKLFDKFKNLYKIPVIVISGSSKFHDLMLSGKIQTDFYFDIPFDVYDFMDAIKKCLMITSGKKM